MPGGERVPFLFTVKELDAKGKVDGPIAGPFLVPSYRGSTFLDPKVKQSTELRDIWRLFSVVHLVIVPNHLTLVFYLVDFVPAGFFFWPLSLCRVFFNLWSGVLNARSPASFPPAARGFARAPAFCCGAPGFARDTNAAA